MKGCVEMLKNLKRLMEIHGISTKTLAELSGVSLRSIQAYLKGDFSPSIDAAIKIADALDVTLDLLCDRDSSGLIDSFSDLD